MVVITLLFSIIICCNPLNAMDRMDDVIKAISDVASECISQHDVAQFVSYLVDANAVNKFGQPHLHQAVEAAFYKQSEPESSIEIIKALLDYGACINDKDCAARTPIEVLVNQYMKCFEFELTTLILPEPNIGYHIQATKILKLFNQCSIDPHMSGKCGSISADVRKRCSEIVWGCVERSASLFVDKKRFLPLGHALLEFLASIDEERSLALWAHIRKFHLPKEDGPGTA